MASHVTEFCSHELQSGALRFDGTGALYACLVCDDCGAMTRELPGHSADARGLVLRPARVRSAAA